MSVSRPKAIVFYILSAGAAITAVATLVNMVLISTREETISVVNAFIAQILIIAVLMAAARIFLKKAQSNWPSRDNADSHSQNSGEDGP